MPRNIFRLDRRLTAMMVEDFIHDPVLAANILLGIEVPPHEEIRLSWMWTTPFTEDDSGFSTGKSHNIAVVSALRSILFPERISGIISKTFRQGKRVFANYDKWYYNSAIFRSCVVHIKGQPRLVHGNEAHQAFFKGNSEIRVIPPGFLSDAEKVRSERWNDGYFDEWTTYGNFSSFNKIIMGRVTEKNKYPDDPIRGNHAHLMSTPGYTFDPAFSIVRKFNNMMLQGNKDYGRITFNYRHVPKNQRWGFLVNRRVIFDMQISNPPGVVGAEVDGRWQDDSGAYYSLGKITEARYKIAPVVTKRLKGEEIFIGGFDVASGGSGNRGDDFSFSVARLNGNDKPHHCLTVRRNKVTAREMSSVIHKVHSQLNLSIIMYDPGGGGLFVRDELKEEEQFIDEQLYKVSPIIEVMDGSGVIGTNILFPVKRGDVYINRMWGKMASDSVLVNRIHKAMKTAIENREIILSGVFPDWPEDPRHFDINAKRKWLNQNRAMPERDRYAAEMDLAVCQLSAVDIVRREDGTAFVDSYGMYKFKSKGKKDSAYSLVYMNLGILLWKFIRGSGMITGGKGRKPVIASSPI